MCARAGSREEDAGRVAVGIRLGLAGDFVAFHVAHLHPLGVAGGEEFLHLVYGRHCHPRAVDFVCHVAVGLVDVSRSVVVGRDGGVVACHVSEAEVSAVLFGRECADVVLGPLRGESEVNEVVVGVEGDGRCGEGLCLTVDDAVAEVYEGGVGICGAREQSVCQYVVCVVHLVGVDAYAAACGLLACLVGGLAGSRSRDDDAALGSVLLSLRELLGGAGEEHGVGCHFGSRSRECLCVGENAALHLALVADGVLEGDVCLVVHGRPYCARDGGGEGLSAVCGCLFGEGVLGRAVHEVAGVGTGALPFESLHGAVERGGRGCDVRRSRHY